MLWEIDIHPAEGQPDRAGERVASAAHELGIADGLHVAAARGYLVQGASLERADIERLAGELLADHVVERAVIGRVGEAGLYDFGFRISDFGLAEVLPRVHSIRNPQSAIRNWFAFLIRIVP